ncbi:MAG: cytidine deaminase [Eubacteriales bacterium]
MTDAQLVALASTAMAKAYAPYSGYRVGAALLTAEGRVFTGCNIENAAYSPTCCAERTAVFKAVSEGFCDFLAIAVVGGRNGMITAPCPPCGVCRQVLAEFCRPDSFRVVLGHADGQESHTLESLLPRGFFPGQIRP